ncbi:hypothetical protein C8J57DRAFT_206720 [Mycena rebaudengoi]|nr:hypothetical protein C8J57DRAFT_206720 [Mycena rebaudengoi]
MRVKRFQEEMPLSSVKMPVAQSTLQDLRTPLLLAPWIRPSPLNWHSFIFPVTKLYHIVSSRRNHVGNIHPLLPGLSPVSSAYRPSLACTSGQICGTWRQIAFDTPWLWRAIHIYLSSAGESTMSAQLNVLTTWLSRSKNCPLSISFEIQFDLSSPTLPHFTAALISHSERWQHLVLDIPFDDLRSLDRQFPPLRDLTLGPSHYGPAGALTVFHSAPQLKRVLFGRLLNPSRVNLPWAQLTHILARNLFLPVAAQILRQASALVEFTCILKASGDIFGDALAPLIHLESLILYVWDGMAIQKQVLDALTAPMLRHLTISEHSLGEQLVLTLAAFFSRSGCSLETLRVSDSPRQAADYRVLFPAIAVIDVFDCEEGPIRYPW